MKAVLPSSFVRTGKPLLEIDVMEYLEEYIPYIKFICKKRTFLKESWEDMEQFIIMELIKNYSKKWKYDDFDWVTRSIIRRKATDFTVNYCKRNEDLVFENQMVDERNNVDAESAKVFGSNAKSIENFEIEEKHKKIVSFIKDLDFKIRNPPYKIHFSDWGREYLEVVIELYEYGYDCDKEDIMECMGYEKNESTKFNAKLLAFRNKLLEYFSLEYDLF